MKKRLAVVTAGLLAGLMALGTANALVIDTAPGTETELSETAVAGTETVYEVGDAGTVTVTNDGAQLEIVSVNQNDGWVIEIETATGREVEVDFRNGIRRIQFNAELEDGQIRVRARERVVAATNATQSTTSTTPTTQSTTQPTTATTAATEASSSATGTTTYQAGVAGTVTVSNDGSRLTITAVDAANGWSHEIEVQVGREVEMDFRNGGDRVQFNAELEDGQVRVRVRTRTADGSRTEVTNGVNTTDDGSGSSSSNDDNSRRSGSDDDSDDDDSDDDDSDDDNSGRDNSTDDNDSDDDNSGQGSPDDDDDSSDD